jgi:hypothetical protein
MSEAMDNNLADRAEAGEDAACTDCSDTGITHQTERVCSCEYGLKYARQSIARSQADGR